MTLYILQKWLCEVKSCQDHNAFGILVVSIHPFIGGNEDEMAVHMTYFIQASLLSPPRN
jgi:hypothetical protein